MRDATYSLAITPSLDREMFSDSVDVFFVLALPFQPGDFEPDCEFRRGGAYVWDKNTSARLCTINAGGLMREGGVFTGHYGKYSLFGTYTLTSLVQSWSRHSTVHPT